MFVRQSICKAGAFVATRPSRFVRITRNFSSYPSHEVVAMPALSPTMEAGTIGKWLVKPGDTISPGTAIAEIETDKATIAFEAQDDFVIAKLLAEAGSEVKVGQPILISVESADSVSAFSNYKVADSPAPAAPAAPAPKAEPTPAPTPAAAPVKATPPPAAAAPAPAKAAPVPAPAQAAPAAKAPTPAVAAPAGNTGFSGARWGNGVKKSALLGKLATQQAKYVELYGRSSHKPL